MRREATETTIAVMGLLVGALVAVAIIKDANDQSTGLMRTPDYAYTWQCEETKIDSRTGRLVYVVLDCVTPDGVRCFYSGQSVSCIPTSREN